MKWIIGLLCLVSLTCGTCAVAQATEPGTFKLTIVSGTYRNAARKEVTGTGEFPAGAKIWITADDAAPGKLFDQWSGDTKVLGTNGIKEARMIIVMPAEDITLTATYKEYKAIRVACIGDTPTDMTNYPKELSKYLNALKDAGNGADSYDVRNYGVPDSTIVQTEKPWVKTPKCASALAFQPNIVVIMMGGQDTQKGKNFAQHETFVPEYEKLVGLFSDLPTHPKVYICLPPPMMADGKWGLNNENLVSTIIPGVKQVAADLKLPLIDTNTPFIGHPELFHDNVHLVGQSNVVLAGAVYRELTGNEPPVSESKK